MVQVPEVDDPRWFGTKSMDSVLVTLADTLRRDPRPGSGESPDDVRETPFERWHTLFVRAVDDRGLPDPTPDYRSFNSTNIAPTVYLESPVDAGHEFGAPQSVTFHWDGEDAIDEFNSIEPVAARSVIISSRVDLSRPGNKYVNYPDSLYVLPKRMLAIASFSPYVSATPADPVHGIEYPLTADGQPTFILAKGAPQDAFFSRAFCGFEPILLTEASHLALTRFLLIEQFHLGSSPPLRPLAHGLALFDGF